MKPTTLQNIATTACAVIAVAAVTVAVILGLAVSNTASDAKDAVHQVVAQRTESRERLCEKDKRFAEAHNRLVIAIATDAGTHPIDPDVQAAVDANTVTVPDCTPTGIAKFYGSPAR